MYCVDMFPKIMLQGGRGGALSCEWFTSVNGGGPFRSDRSLPVPKDRPQYIPKGNPTPASKLAFVNSHSKIAVFLSKSGLMLQSPRHPICGKKTSLADL